MLDLHSRPPSGSGVEVGAGGKQASEVAVTLVRRETSGYITSLLP